MSQTAKRPLNILQKAINKDVAVRLKNESEYRGRMANVDQFMNVILANAEEYNSGTISANFGKVVIRGNNVLYIRIDNELGL